MWRCDDVIAAQQIVCVWHGNGQSCWASEACVFTVMFFHDFLIIVNDFMNNIPG